MTIHLPNITILDASNIKLSRIDRQDFAPSSKIQFLNASFNKLHELSTGMTNSMKGLTNLDLSHNVIDRIDDEAFENRENLKFLNLSNNRIGKISVQFLNSVRSLEILRLDNNRITEITGYDGLLVMNLKELHLQNNNLKSFNPSIIPFANYLDISLNDLQQDLDVSSTQLIELNIKSNLLTSLKLNRKILVLDASDNEDKSFQLNFNFNQVLQSLNLSNLDIPSYKKIIGDMKNLKNLTTLDLSKNAFGIFDFDDLFLPNLENLSLSHCSIYTLKNWQSLKSAFGSIKSIDIRGNYLHCDDMQSIIDKFRLSKIIEGLSDGDSDNEKDFLSKNCASDHHKHKEQEYDDKKSEVKVLWTFVILFMLGYVVGALYFINKRYDLISKIKERASKVTHHEIDTSQFNRM